MSMTSLRSRLSFMKGLAPSAVTRAGLSGSSIGPPAGALGDLRVTVRASPPGTSPRTSYSSHSERPVRFPVDFAGPSYGAPSISFGALSEDRMSIAASGDGLTSSEDEGAAGLPPSGVVATAAPDPELTAMLARAAVNIRLNVNRPPSPEPSWLDDWFPGAGRDSQPRSWRCMRSWQSRGWPLSRPKAARLSPLSSLLSTAGLPGGMRAFPRRREPSQCTCAHEAPPLVPTWGWCRSYAWPVPFGTQGVRRGCLRTRHLLYHPVLLPFTAPPQVSRLRRWSRLHSVWSAELPEFLQRQECGTTETVSEAPGAYGIRSCSHAAWVASY